MNEARSSTRCQKNRHSFSLLSLSLPSFYLSASYHTSILPIVPITLPIILPIILAIPAVLRAVSPAFLQSVFSIQSLDGIDCSQLVLLQNPDELSNRVNAIVNALREERSTFMQLNVVSPCSRSIYRKNRGSESERARER